MKNVKNILVLFLMFTFLFVGANIKKVSAYKCYYKGEKMDTDNFWAKAEGELVVNINSATSVKADFSEFKSQDNEFLARLYSAFGSGTGIPVPNQRIENQINAHLFDRPLDKISYTKNSLKEKYSVDYYTQYTEQMSKFFKSKKCPSNINVSYLTCGEQEAAIAYNFNADIWDWFSSNDQIATMYVLEDSGTTLKKCTYDSKSGKNTVAWQLDKSKTKNSWGTLMFVCKKLGNYLYTESNSLKNLYSSYQDCKKKFKDNQIKCQKLKSSYENKLLVVRNWCKSVTDSRMYNSTCLQGCVDLNKKVYDINCVRGSGKNKKDICTNNGGNCNLSEEIIAFVYNILKWFKYIAPVLVIMLGILDFIKALASQDDDAMKKAQGRFIKRLIAATLLFLLPLIIDYILNVFDLYDSSCDVTELFK